MLQVKGQDKISEKELNETEISNLPEKRFKLMVIKILSEFRRRLEEHSENFNKKMENIKKNQSGCKKKIMK